MSTQVRPAALPRRGISNPSAMNRVRLALVLLLAAVLPALRAQETTTITRTPRSPRIFRVLVIPYDPLGLPGAPARPPWLTADLVQASLFATGFAPADATGQPLASGSVRDYFARQYPGLEIQGELVPIPSASAVGGFYQYDARTADLAGMQDEEVTHQHARTMLNRLGYGNGPEIVNNPFGTGSPLEDARRRHKADLLGFVTAGSPVGSVRQPDGILTAYFNVGLGEQANWEWLGVATHEFGHAVGLADDHYHLGFEGEHSWNLMSTGYGAFPAPLPAWLRHRFELPRLEATLRRGESSPVILPAWSGPGPGAEEPKILVLPQGTLSGNGREEELFVEARQRLAPGSPMDTARAGLPDGNGQGLYIQSVDWRASGWFASPTFESSLPEIYSGPPRGGTWPPRFSPVQSLAAIRSHGGGLYANVLFPPGQALLGPRRADPALTRSRSSSNLDGNVLWQLFDLAPLGDVPGLGFLAQWAGIPLAREAATLGRGRSPEGEMAHSPDVTPTGAFWHEEEGSGVVAGWRDVLHLQSNRSGPPFRATVRWPHFAAANGAVAVFTPVPLTFKGDIEVTLKLLNADGAEVRRCTVPASLFPPRPGHLDLTVLSGQACRLEIEAEGTAPFHVALLDSWAFRKGESTLALLSQQGGTSPTPGASGPLRDVLAEDGVTYDRVLAFQLEGAPDRRATRSFPGIEIPASGALLRASIGFPQKSAGISDGASLRLLLDDGYRRWLLPESLASHGDVAVATATGSPATYPFAHSWGIDLAFSPSPAWTAGDWVLAGDADGDGDQDLVVFSPDGKVGVARSLRNRFALAEKWVGDFFGSRDVPLVADFNGDLRADVLRITPEGDVRIALSNGTGFTPRPEPLARDAVRPGEVALTGDVNGDGLADLVVCTLAPSPAPPGSGNADRLQGLVRVHRALRSGIYAPPEAWAFSGLLNPGVTPLLGDVDASGAQDLVLLQANGRAYHLASDGVKLGPATLWFDGGPTHPATDPVRIPGQPNPGSRHTTGPIVFFTPVNNPTQTPALLCFNRSAVPGNAARDVLRYTESPAAPQTAVTTQLSDSFGADSDWPLVADFSGDGVPDLLVMAPASDSSTTLYLSPRPAITVKRASTETSPATFSPRLNRLEVDLSRWAGRTVTLSVELDAGPSDAGDLVVFPELKVYGKALPYRPQRPDLSSPFPGVLRLAWAAEQGNSTIEESTDLREWGPASGQASQTGSGFFLDAKILDDAARFWRILPPLPDQGDGPPR